MKIKGKFVLREIAGEYVIVQVGSSTLNFNNLMTVNEVGRLIWMQLQNETTEEEIVRKITEEYEVAEDTAKADVNEFLEKLKKENLLLF